MSAANMSAYVRDKYIINRLSIKPMKRLVTWLGIGQKISAEEAVWPQTPRTLAEAQTFVDRYVHTTIMRGFITRSAR